MRLVVRDNFHEGEKMKKMEMLCIMILLLIPAAKAAANLEVTAFACNPSEVVANSQFSCTATVQNSGDAAGTLNTATLYADANNWLENSNYPETVNSNINSGASVQVTFDNLKGKKSGYNGFSKIMLDDVTDTYTADNGVKVNVIDIVGTVTASASSAASSATVDVTGQATAGGNVDITLTFSVSSGGCSIGNQPASTTTSSMSNGQTTSRTWTVTMGSANCAYSVSAKATSNPSGTATKTDANSNTITCSGCTSTDTTAPSSGGGGGGGGGAASSKNATANKTAVSAKKAQCVDGIDNDNDGLIDLKDPGCESVEDEYETDITACTQSWECGEWSACANNKQERTCVDKNDCLAKKAGGSVVAETPKPEEIRSCGVKEPVSLPQVIKDYGLWIIVFATISIFLGYLYYHGHHHVKKAKKIFQ